MSAPPQPTAPLFATSLTDLVGSISCGLGLTNNESDNESEGSLIEQPREVALAARDAFSPSSHSGDEAEARARAWGGAAPATPGAPFERALRQLRLFGGADAVDHGLPTPGGTRDVLLQVVQKRRSARAAVVTGETQPTRSPSHSYDVAVGHSPRPPAASRLHEWLLSRSLGAHFEALERLGAKRVSDLALLTADDLDQLGISSAERGLFRIELR